MGAILGAVGLGVFLEITAEVVVGIVGLSLIAVGLSVMWSAIGRGCGCDD